MRVTQKVFDGRGTVRVPHRNTIIGIGSDSILADAICKRYFYSFNSIIKIIVFKLSSQIYRQLWIINKLF